MPETNRACGALQCGHKSDLHERIACRLGLTPAGIARELEIQYLPEECRAISNTGLRTACVARYKSYEPCWQLPDGEARFSCAHTALKLGPVISDEVKTCDGKTGAEQVTCKNAVKEKVFAMIKFRFYDLEERAEDLVKDGADKNAVADFVAAVELKKQAWNAATATSDQKQIILDVRDLWKSFVDKVKDQVKKII